jgi:DNA-binding transcriptional LysR family regulator
MRRPRIETFDLNLLRIFDAVFQHGSVNSAASEIGVSPSAISHALGRLRYVFDDELFVKGPGGMTPTARAAEIADRIAALLLQVHSVFEPAEFEPDMADRHFKLRCNNYLGWLILPHVASDFRNQQLGINMTVQCDDGRDIADDLDTGSVDLVLGSFGHLPERFESESLFLDDCAWVLRADHPALSGELTTEKLLQLPQLVIASAEVARSIDGVVTEAGLERPVVMDKIFLGDIKNNSRYSVQVKGALITNGLLAAPGILAQSDLVAMLPTRLAEMMSGHHELTTIRIDTEDPKLFEHRMIWHRKHGADPAFSWLRSVIRTSVATWVKG